MTKQKFICEQCNKDFLEYASNRTKKHIYCSKKCVDKSKIGHTPWNKGFGEYMKGIKNHFFGKSHTEESLKKISETGKGRRPWNKGIKQWEGKVSPRQGTKQSLETKEKISRVHLGKHPWNYTGDTTDKRLLDHRERVRFRETMQKQVFERDNYTCQMCGSGSDLQVDHIQLWSEYIDLRFSMDNCRTLCKQCHYEITFGKPMIDISLPWGHNMIQKMKGGDYNFR